MTVTITHATVKHDQRKETGPNRCCSRPGKCHSYKTNVWANFPTGQGELDRFRGPRPDHYQDGTGRTRDGRQREAYEFDDFYDDKGHQSQNRTHVDEYGRSQRSRHFDDSTLIKMEEPHEDFEAFGDYPAPRGRSGSPGPGQPSPLVVIDGLPSSVGETEVRTYRCNLLVPEVRLILGLQLQESITRQTELANYREFVQVRIMSTDNGMCHVSFRCRSIS